MQTHRAVFVVFLIGFADCWTRAGAFLPRTQSSTRSVFSYSNRLLASSSSSSAEEEAKALLEKVKQMREEIASLEGTSYEKVEQEAQDKANRERQVQQQQEELRRERKQQKPHNDRKQQGTFLNVPELFEDQVHQASDAVTRAFQDGVTRQIVRFALFPEDETLNQQDRLWPGGPQQMYREAAEPLTVSLLQQLRTSSEDFRKPNVTAQTIWDFDGSAVVSAEAPSGPKNDVQALVFPNTDDKYSKDIQTMGEAMKDRLLLLINPFWRDLDSWGINLLAPKAKQLAQKGIFDQGFQETYVLLQISVRGEDCVALKAYPYDWQLYAYAEQDYWPYDETIVHLGSSEEEPTSTQFTELLNARDEFKLSKNMRRMQRMINKQD